jgi:hypothetical protein
MDAEDGPGVEPGHGVPEVSMIPLHLVWQRSASSAWCGVLPLGDLWSYQAPRSTSATVRSVGSHSNSTSGLVTDRSGPFSRSAFLGRYFFRGRFDRAPASNWIRQERRRRS